MTISICFNWGGKKKKKKKKNLIEFKIGRNAVMKNNSQVERNIKNIYKNLSFQVKKLHCGAKITDEEKVL